MRNGTKSGCYAMRRKTERPGQNNRAGACAVSTKGRPRTTLIVSAAVAVAGCAAWLTAGQISATADRTTAQSSQADTVAEAKYTAEQFLAACRSLDQQTTAALRAACQLAASQAAKPAPAVVTPVAPRTDAEIRALVVETVRLNPGLLPRGLDGRDAVLTDADYRRIADMVQARVTNGTNGTNGATGERGPKGDPAVVDYDAIVTAVLKLVPTPKDGTNGAKGDKGDTGATGATGPAGPACPDGYKSTEHTDLSGSYLRCDKT